MSQIGMEPESGRTAETDLQRFTPDSQGARWMRRHIAAGVAVLTTEVDGQFRGATVGSAIVVSTEPVQMLVSIELDSQMDDWLARSGFFALSLLPWSAQFLADQFAGFTPRASPRFDRIQHFLAESGSPILRDTIAWIDCRVVATLVTGDHRCFVGEAQSLGSGTSDPEDPMVYYLNRYRRFR